MSVRINISADEFPDGTNLSVAGMTFPIESAGAVGQALIRLGRSCQQLAANRLEETLAEAARDDRGKLSKPRKQAGSVRTTTRRR